MVPVVEKILPVGHPNRPGVKLESLKAIVIHYTGNENASATDTANVAYISRKYDKGPYKDQSSGKLKEDYLEFGSVKGGIGTQFSYGSAHVFCDMDSITLAIPTDEVAWSCGDRRILPWTPEWKGQQKIAARIFGNRQNFQSISVEICNNDVVKDSEEDWEASVSNAAEWVNAFLKGRKLSVNVEASLNPQIFMGPLKEGQILVLRHYDLSGKECPKKFVEDTWEWEAFVNGLVRIV